MLLRHMLILIPTMQPTAWKHQRQHKLNFCYTIIVLLQPDFKCLFFCFSAECHELMLRLKATVEGLLALPSVNVWNIHGGLERLDRCIRHILKHRIKASSVSYLHRAFIRESLQLLSVHHQTTCQFTTKCKGNRVISLKHQISL